MIDRAAAKLSEELLPTFREIAMTPLPIRSEEDKEKYARGVVFTALEVTVELEKNTTLAARTRAETAGNTEEALRLAQKLQDLDRELVMLKSRR